MAKSHPIKTDVFRFITFRSPEPMLLASRNIRFVTNPFLSKSIISHCPIPNEKDSGGEIFQDYLRQFKSMKTLEEIRAIDPSLFDYSDLVVKKKKTVSQIFNDFNQTALREQSSIVEELFHQLYYQVLSRESAPIRQAISRMLIVNHVVSNAKVLLAENINKLTDLKIEIPEQVIACLKPNRYKKCGGELHGVQNLGIADFRRVEQEVCCYVPGEVSHIENVMAREYKERSTRNYVRTENNIETSRETEIENYTDVATTIRNEVTSEVANVLQQDRNSGYGGSVGVSATIFGADVNINTYADFATSNSSSYSNTEAKTYAEEVTKRAVERIVQRTSERRTSKIIKEFEEANKHGFDNRNGDKHVTGVYRWLDIIYTNRLVNYGKRLMVEFMVPEPAEFYKRMLRYVVPKQPGQNDPVNEIEPPKSLKDYNINSYKDINRNNFTDLANEYGIVINGPLQETKIVTQAFSPTPPIRHNGPDWTQQFSITIEPDYVAESINGNYSFRWKAVTGEKAYFTYKIGNVNGGRSNLRGREQTTTGTFSNVLSPAITQAVPVQFSGDKIYTYGVTINVNCRLSAAKFEEWQQAAYNQLMEAYQSLLDQFNDSLVEEQEETQATEDERKETNPALNRLIEQRELKRICLEMVMKPYCRTQGRNNLTDINACDLYDIPQVNQTKEFAEYASQVKFFEQAVDWTLMSYLFYPYYWADKCDWAELMQSNSSDLIFEAFMQSGMARVVVPVRQQFTEAFLYYLETGEIWLGNDLVPGTDSNLYLSIAEEMQTVEGTVEEEWETRVPTTLSIIQGKSAYLEQEGLPCCDKAQNDDTISGIIGTDQVLQIINP
jgi:hypothetical protein